MQRRTAGSLQHGVPIVAHDEDIICASPAKIQGVLQLLLTGRSMCIPAFLNTLACLL